MFRCFKIKRSLFVSLSFILLRKKLQVIFLGLFFHQFDCFCRYLKKETKVFRRGTRSLRSVDRHVSSGGISTNHYQKGDTRCVPKVTLFYAFCLDKNKMFSANNSVRRRWESRLRSTSAELPDSFISYEKWKRSLTWIFLFGRFWIKKNVDRNKNKICHDEKQLLNNRIYFVLTRLASFRARLRVFLGIRDGNTVCGGSLWQQNRWVLLQRSQDTIACNTLLGKSTWSCRFIFLRNCRSFLSSLFPGI